MGNVTKRVTEQSAQLSRTMIKSISGLALIGVFLAAANEIRVEGNGSPEAKNAQGAAGQTPEFYISISTDERDHPGLSTVVVAGPNRFMFDCGVVSSVPRRWRSVPCRDRTLSDESRRDDS